MLHSKVQARGNIMSDQNYDNNSNENKISYINTWFKIIIISAITGVILYKVLLTPIDLSAFNFSDLLSLVLAIFAISLSVMFYYKANDTSNLFYDNTYKFTKDISIILGRIEAGFGERLKHLDEGYAGLRDKMYQAPSSETSAKKEIEKEEKALQKVVDERDSIIKDLLEQTALQEKEKANFLSSLKEKEVELDSARKSLNILRSELAQNRELFSEERRLSPKISSAYIDYLIHKLSEVTDIETIRQPSKFIKVFLDIKDNLPDAWIDDGKKMGVINSKGMPTPSFIEMFLDYIKFQRKV